MIVLTAAAGGMVVDRYRPMPLPAWCAVPPRPLFSAGSFCRGSGRFRPPRLALPLAVACLAAAWHHYRWNLFGADDIGLFASLAARAGLRRGCGRANAAGKPGHSDNPLRLAQLDDEFHFTVELRAIRDGDQWRTASGSAVVVVEGLVAGTFRGRSAFAHSRISCRRTMH